MGGGVEVSLEFGRVLRRLRLAAGFTQEQLGHEAGLQRNYVSLMERGVNQPTLTTLFKLAAVLNISASEMIAEVEKSCSEY